MDEAGESALQELFNAGDEVTQNAVESLFRPIFLKMSKMTSVQREGAFFDLKVFFSREVHKRLLKQDIPACLRIVHTSLLAVLMDTPLSLSVLVVLPLKLLCLAVCFQNMSTLTDIVDFVVNNQSSFKRLIPKRATMSFLFTFNILARRLQGRDQALGRLRGFLSACLGIDNRSNFNIGGSLNTRINSQARQDELDNGVKINTALYEQLWRVVRICQNPKILMASGKQGVKWVDFKSDIGEIIKAFKAQPIDIQTARVSSQMFESLEDTFIPQYVTSTRIFQYQLSDATFRRHVLLQICMCLIGHYQLQKCEQRKTGRQYLRTVGSQKDLSWIVNTFETCIRILENTHVFVMGEDGQITQDSTRAKQLAQNFREIMLREFNYVHWKHDRSTKERQCPSFSKKAVKPPTPFVFEATQFAEFGKVEKMGGGQLERVWLDRSSEQDLKDSVPKLSQYLEQHSQGLEDDQTDEFLVDTPKAKRMYDAAFSFHTLRLVRRTNPCSLTQLRDTFKNVIGGTAINNSMFHLLRNRNSELGETARKEFAVAKKTPAKIDKPEPPKPPTKPVKKSPPKTDSKKSELKTKSPPKSIPATKPTQKSKTSRKRASPGRDNRSSKRKRQEERKKFDGMSLDQLT